MRVPASPPVNMPRHPVVEPVAISPDFHDPVARVRCSDPAFDRPPLPVDKVFVAQQVGTWMLRQIGAGGAFELPTAHLVPLVLEGCDDLAALTARSIVGDRLAKPSQLRGIHQVPTAASILFLSVQRNVAATGSAGVD